MALRPATEYAYFAAGRTPRRGHRRGHGARGPLDHAALRRRRHRRPDGRPGPHHRAARGDRGTKARNRHDAGGNQPAARRHRTVCQGASELRLRILDHGRRRPRVPEVGAERLHIQARPAPGGRFPASAGRPRRPRGHGRAGKPDARTRLVGLQVRGRIGSGQIAYRAGGLQNRHLATGTGAQERSARRRGRVPPAPGGSRGLFRPPPHPDGAAGPADPRRRGR